MIDKIIRYIISKKNQMFRFFEKPTPKGQGEEKRGEGTLAGEEVVGSIPAEFVVEKDGKTEETSGSIKVLYDPEMGSEGGSPEEEKDGE
jgi:hypothetical protein